MRIAMDQKHEQELYNSLRGYLAYFRRECMTTGFRRIQAMSLSEREKKTLFRQYVRDYDRYRMKFSEWYDSYQFPKLTESEKKTYLSMRDLQAIQKKYALLTPGQIETTGNKDRFLAEYAPFIHRKWLLIKEDTDPKEIRAFFIHFQQQ